MTEDLNLTSIPTDDQGWRSLAEKLAKVDDTAERHFLELKSDVDLSAKEGRAKVAKFILGAANRSPQTARRHLGGHALMVLGVAKEALTGIPGFEALELQAAVTKYIGEPGPQWDHREVKVADDRYVTFIVVDPPQVSSRPWLCRRTDGAGMKQGDVYLRVDGATRPATPEEFMIMIDEAKESRPKTELGVEIVGSACAFRCDVEILDQYIAQIEDALVSELPKPKPFSASASQASDFGAYLATQGIRDFAASMSTPESRTEAQYLAEIQQWKKDCRNAWPKMLRKLAAVVLPSAHVKITNLSATYLENVNCKIHIEGPIIAIRNKDSKNFSPISKLPDPPRKWGPVMRSLVPQFPDARYMTSSSPADRIFDVVSFKNGNSVDLSFIVSELPPEEVYDSPDDEIVLILDADPGEVPELHATWKITAKGHHQSYRGDVVVQVESRGTRDFSKSVRQSLTKK